MVDETLTAPYLRTRSSLLDRRADLSQVNLEWVAYGLLFVASFILHLWQLGHMAVAHDESVHAYMSWRFFMGRGEFNCAGGRTSLTYCYDPVYHGPTLYFLTLISFFLFGANDATLRLPQALAGVALVPACYLLRPLLGKRTALLGAVLVTLSPSILYFSRYARHDALILLWTLLLMAGLFRWIREGSARWLLLAAASLALAWATHELVFILIFIIGTFLLFRLFWEWRPRLFRAASALGLAIAVTIAAATVFTASNPEQNRLLQRALGPAILGGAGALMALLLTRSWTIQSVLTDRLRQLWATRSNANAEGRSALWGVLPPALWWALGTFLVVFGLLFSTFLAYPRGFLDGFYQGLKYWWLSQHDFARGQQPWYYYLMLLPIYELMALLFALVGIAWLGWGARWRFALPPATREWKADEHSTAPASDGDSGEGNGFHVDPSDSVIAHESTRHSLAEAGTGLFVPFLAYWSVLSMIAFSWAGEKMPWLLIHTALPVTLLATWVLSELINTVPWRKVRTNNGWSVPLLVVAALLLASVASYYLAGAGATQSALRDRLRALPVLAMFGAALFGLLTVAGRLGGRVVLRLAGLTVAALLLLYGIRAAVHVVYLHPDTPIEPLIYVQTAPDVPILVDQIRRIAINQTRNERSAEDPTGGLSMPLVLSAGASKHGGEGSLAWPMQWYFRDFRNLRWIDPDTTSTLDAEAPVAVLAKAYITPAIREQLEEEFVKTSEGVFNWWFPENGPGGGAPRAYKDLAREGPWAVLSWPFRPSNWPTLTRFMIYRDIPHKLNGREMEVYMRPEVAPVGAADALASSLTEPMLIEGTLGGGELSNPRGVTTDGAGNVYVADAFNHRVAVFDPNGILIRTVGSQGSGDGQLNEPSGVAVDAEGNLYVADTWNARIAKFGPDGSWITSWGTGRDDFGGGRRATDTKGNAQGNADNPLGFYGPRNVLVLDDRVYIADTGNKRIVVTDLEGAFVEQWGTWGAEPGQFHEPIGLAADREGRIYVGDTWNGRIQIFRQGDDGKVEPVPVRVVAVSGWDPNTYNDPYLAVAPDGRMLVSLAGRNAVGVFNPVGTLERRLRGDTEQLNVPKGLAMAPDGSLYVVDGGGNEVLRVRLP